VTRQVGNLPAEVSSFVDRRQERIEIKRLLSTSRLVTVTGVGGVGKTRTTLRVATEVRRGFPGGAWLVELGALRDGELLPEVVAEGLGLRDQTVREPAAVLSEYLAPLRLLLVLDGCEHLVDQCAALVRTLLRVAPGLRVLVTSRQSLGVTGERLFPLAPLPVPPEGLQAHEPYSAVELFLERAQAVERRFALTEANHEAVARLCRRLDGIPLAIELAAGRLRALSVQEIVSHLDDRFLLLAGRSRHRPDRHETLRAAIDWSYQLCSPGERLLWTRLSVFPGDFDLAAVGAVCVDDELPADEVLDLVVGLVDKSILLREDRRYRLLDTLREFGRLRLGDEPERLRRHRDHYLALALRCAAEWCGPDQIAWYERITEEHADVRAALEFCLGEPRERQAALALTAALAPVWLACGSLREGRRYLDRAVAMAGEPGPELARAQVMCAWLATIQGDLDTVDVLLEQCRPYDTALAGWIAYVAGTAKAFRGDLAAAVRLCREAADLHGGGFGQLVAIGTQCFAHALANELDLAIPLIERLRGLCDRYGEKWVQSYADYIRAIAELGRADLDAAVAYARDSLRGKQRLGDTVGIVRLLELLAAADVARGGAERAARLLGSAEEIWPTVGSARVGAPDIAASHQRCAQQARERLGEQAYRGAFQTGADLDLAAAIAFALDEPRPAVTRRPAGWAPLTRREREIAEHVAQGLTNQEIATRLVISKRTADSHIHHMFTKLGFTNRAQLAAWVAERRGSAE
jgi:predicted ATPase/DNA-binding CsgD family transcriptional regulator